MIDGDALERAWHGSATVGERGQVVIPASARERLGISPGDKLMVFIHPSGHGVLFLKLHHLQAMLADMTNLMQNLEAEDLEPGARALDGTDE